LSESESRVDDDTQYLEIVRDDQCKDAPLYDERMNVDCKNGKQSIVGWGEEPTTLEW
jgi:hypothetical protein